MRSPVEEDADSQNAGSARPVRALTRVRCTAAHIMTANAANDYTLPVSNLPRGRYIAALVMREM
jgi:hypothetical protein